MLKIKLLSFFFVTLLVGIVKSELDMMKVVEECKNKAGATDEDLAKIILNAKPENRQQKCVVSCLLDATNIVRFDL